MDLNDELQEAYTALTESVVDAINADSVIDFLFAAKVLSAADYGLLNDISERKKKTRKLLVLLHTGRHPQAFIKLHEAIKRESAYIWLMKKIDDLRMPSKMAASGPSKRVGKGILTLPPSVKMTSRRKLSRT